jgi:diketogulonate reductase-like aldo/keto reductase
VDVHDNPQAIAGSKRIGVSNFCASHLTKLLDVCQEFNLEKPFANEVQINLLSGEGNP